ncbi:hypothetical protein H8D36_03380 [archaeon]|nr:hypothetical protein [archaeon]
MDYIIDYEVKNNVYKKIALKLITVGFTSSIDLCEIPAPDLKKPITGKIVQCKLF